VKNSCGVTIFPAYAGKSGHLSQEGKVAPGGWELEAGGETVLDIPDVCEWLSIRRHPPCDRELNRRFIMAADSLLRGINCQAYPGRMPKFEESMWMIQ